MMDRGIFEIESRKKNNMTSLGSTSNKLRFVKSVKPNKLSTIN